MIKMKWLFLVYFSVLFLLLTSTMVGDSTAQGPSSVTVLISGPTYDQEKNLYRGRISVSNPQNVYRLLYSVEDADAGTVIVPETEINLGGFNSRPYELSGTLFKPERKYILKIQAVDWKGNLIPRSDESHALTPGERFILASKEFVHMPPAPPRFEFQIEYVNADYTTGTLTIKLSLPATADVLRYDGFIVDDSGQRVGVIQEALYRSPEVTTTLPGAIRRANEEHSYKIVLNLYTRDEQQAQASYEVKLKPPPQPNLLERVSSALAQQPYIALTILVVISLFAVVVILFGKSGRSNQITLVRPPIEHTMPGKGPQSRGWLIVRVISSPGPSRGLEKRLTRFPCMIGRDESCDVCIKDPAVSGKHVEISYQDGKFFLTDFSKNGTFIGETRLSKLSATPLLSDNTRVRLGDNTVLELITDD